MSGAQDVTNDLDLDFTGRLAQSAIQRPLRVENRQYPICVLDIETTGFSNDRDSIIEIAILRIDENENGATFEEFEYLLRPPRSIPKKITELTGITNEMVADAEGLDLVLPRAKEFVGDCPIIAHSASFDRGMLEHKSNQLGISFADNEWICTLQMARRAWPNRQDHKLKRFALELGLGEQRHRALDDCRIAWMVYSSAFEKLNGDINLPPMDLPEFESDLDYQSLEYDSDLEHEVFVFSGFRDDVLAARIENCGGTIKGNISRKVTRLLVASLETSTTKQKKAREYDIAIQTREEFTEAFYS